MGNKRFPQELLESPVADRINYFENFAVNHPNLNNIYKGVLNNIDETMEDTILFVFGPSRVGKSFLSKKLKDKVIEENRNEMEADPSFIPLVWIEAHPSENLKFDWKEFYIQILEELGEPLINHKVFTEEVAELNFQKVSINKRKKSLAIKKSVLKAIKARNTKLLIIDEAQHIANVSKGSSLKNQMEILKSLTNTTDALIVLLGTYELTPLMNLSDQYQ